MINKKIVILYDGGCSDGFGGAWAAWKVFGNKADYVGVRHDEPPPRGLKNKTIYLIDFTYSEAVMKKFLRENRRVTSIDHHATAEKAAKLTEKYLYSINHSGCVLAWQYFHPKKPLPKLLKHIEDTDLWKFKVPHTKEIFAYLNLFPLNFQLWDKLIKDMENPAKYKSAVQGGKLLLQYEEKRFTNLMENAQKVRFCGYKTLAVNSANWPSQIGNLLVKKMPPIGIVWHQRANKISVSLRSNGAVNVGKLAEKFGGGGHKKASGFSLPLNKKLPWKILK